MSKGPGWGHWQTLWAEIVCNLFGCKWAVVPGSYLRPSTKFCRRCRRSVNA